MTRVTRLLFLVSGLFCLLMGFIGAFLPLLPTVPFLLLAAFCFSKSSTRLHNWLLDQKNVGPIIRDWEEYGVIQLRDKCLASLMMVVLVSYPLFFLTFSWMLKSLVIATISAVLVFIWTRPSDREQSIGKTA